MKITKAQEKFVWPAQSQLNFYRKDTNGDFHRELSSTERLFDLSDNIAPEDTKSRTVYFGLSTRSPKWLCWDEEAVQQIEERIRYDLHFDGCRVTIRRDTTLRDTMPCTEEFVWKLVISE